MLWSCKLNTNIITNNTNNLPAQVCWNPGHTVHHSPSMSGIAHSSHMDIFQNLAMAVDMDMDTEGRYLFLNCIANQLRYPNSHTQYCYTCLLRQILRLFRNKSQSRL